MKFKTLFAVAMASIASFFAFADQGDVLITFSTQGPDKYADGAPVKDGEWYALCWSKDGSFDGLTMDCKPINTAEEVILVAPLAKGGKCPFTAFEFARNDKYNSGKFSVLMLDTRDASGKVAAKRADALLPAFVNGASVATTAEKGSAMEVAAQTGVVSGDYTPANLPDTAKPAKIAAFEIDKDYVVLTVVNLSGPCVVKTGKKVDDMGEFVISPIADNDSATVIIPKEKGNFFSAVSLPAVK